MLRRPRLCSLCDRKAEVLVVARVDTLTFRNTCLGCVADRRLLGWTVKVA